MSFIQTLYPDEKLNNNYILIWCLKTKKSNWFKSSKEADKFVESTPRNADYYIGVGLSPKNYGDYRRCDAKDITAITGAYLDIDIFQEEAHKKHNLPKTIDEALRIIDGMPVPTFIIHSGHGLQVWWLFDEIWNFANSEEHDKAATFTKAWTDLARTNAAKLGYDVDSTGDLSRVLRIPGTVNNKIPSEPVAVTIYEESNIRYKKEELFSLCTPFNEIKSKSTIVTTYTPVELDENAVPPFDKFNQLINNNVRFKKTFNYQRKDLQDQSPSSYDFSLIMQTIKEGWSDEEITALLISFRRTNKHDLKLDRNDNYYTRSIKEARNKYAEKLAESDFKKETLSELIKLEKLDSGEMSTCDIIRTLNERLNIEMLCITKYLTDPPQFRLVMQDDKNIMLGDVGNLIGQSAFRKNVAAVAGICIKTFKQAAWDIIAQLLLSACVEEEMDAESTESGYIISNIKGYLEVRKVVDDVEVGIAGKRPFYATIDGEQYIQFFGEDFRKWFFACTGERLVPKSMGIMIKSIGLSNKSYKFKSKVYDLWRIDKKSPLYIGQIEKNNLLSGFDEIPLTSLPADLFK